MRNVAVEGGPASIWKKWHRYRARYGAVHAGASYLGRLSPVLWRLIGPAATRRYLRAWLRRPAADVRVNLGSGSHRIEGFLNADMDPRADVYVDITRALPFADGSVSAVFLEEVIEHVAPTKARALAAELGRVLAPNGVVRVTTPDMQFLTDIPAGRGEVAGMIEADARRFLGGDGSEALLRAGFVNSSFYFHGHRCLYTHAALVDLFTSAGPFAPRESHYRDAHGALGRFDSHAERFGHPPELSLYIEFTKTASGPAAP